MSLTQELWLANQDLAAAALQSPFVQGIADGSLNRPKFIHYVGQDAFFLEAFARAYNICAAHAPNMEVFARFHEFTAGVLEELALHQNYAKQWGIDLKRVQPADTTRQYVDFLLATAWGQEMGLAMVAMVPCMRLYAYLGQELAKRPVNPDNPYSDWIQTYSHADFQQLATALETLSDRYSPHSETTSLTYRYAMQCELNFFQAMWEVHD